MSPVLAPAAEHVEPMGPEGLGGYSRSNAGALLLLARDQLYTRYILDRCGALWFTGATAISIK